VSAAGQVVSQTQQAGCGAPAGGAAMTAGASGEAVIEGHVTRDGTPASTGYARLLNNSGEFVAEVPLGTDGGFRFFAAPGRWTVRALTPGGGRTQETVSADHGLVAKVELAV
jgi:hypothetical protein